MARLAVIDLDRLDRHAELLLALEDVILSAETLSHLTFLARNREQAEENRLVAMIGDRDLARRVLRGEP